MRSDASFTLSPTVSCANIAVTAEAGGARVQDGSVAVFDPDEGCAETAVVTDRALRIARSCDFGVPVVFTR